MSFRAHRISDKSRVESFNWGGENESRTAQPQPSPRQAATARVAPLQAPPTVDRDELEREAFNHGYSQGERAGAEA